MKLYVLRILKPTRSPRGVCVKEELDFRALSFETDKNKNIQKNPIDD